MTDEVRLRWVDSLGRICEADLPREAVERFARGESSDVSSMIIRRWTPDEARARLDEIEARMESWLIAEVLGHEGPSAAPTSR
jgi:hypothetical protein